MSRTMKVKLPDGSIAEREVAHVEHHENRMPTEYPQLNDGEKSIEVLGSSMPLIVKTKYD